MKLLKNCKKLTIWRGHSARLWRASRAQYLIPRVYAIPISRGRVTRDKKQLRSSCYHGGRVRVMPGSQEQARRRRPGAPGQARRRRPGAPGAGAQCFRVGRFRSGRFRSGPFGLGLFSFQIGPACVAQLAALEKRSASPWIRSGPARLADRPGQTAEIFAVCTKSRQKSAEKASGKSAARFLCARLRSSQVYYISPLSPRLWKMTNTGGIVRPGARLARIRPASFRPTKFFYSP